MCIDCNIPSLVSVCVCRVPVACVFEFLSLVIEVLVFSLFDLSCVKCAYLYTHILDKFGDLFVTAGSRVSASKGSTNGQHFFASRTFSLSFSLVSAGCNMRRSLFLSLSFSLPHLTEVARPPSQYHNSQTTG